MRGTVGLCFGDRRREDCRKFAALLDRLKLDMEGNEGDSGEDETCPKIPSSIFDIKKRKRQTIYHMKEVGCGGEFHSCDFGNVFPNANPQPFLSMGEVWKTEGKKGYSVKLSFLIEGVVDWRPPGRWVHVSNKRFVVHFPEVFHQVLGETMEISGEFILIGEKMLRQKKTRIGFVEDVKGLAFAKHSTQHPCRNHLGRRLAICSFLGFEMVGC